MRILPIIFGIQLARAGTLHGAYVPYHANCDTRLIKNYQEDQERKNGPSILSFQPMSDREWSKL